MIQTVLGTTGRTQTEEEISTLAKMSRPASLFPSSLPETEEPVLDVKGDTFVY